MTDTVRRIRSHAHWLDMQTARDYPDYRGDTHVCKFVYDERNRTGHATMRAIVKCSLPTLEIA